MDRAGLDAAYNNTSAVGQAKRDEYVADWSRRSDAIRKLPGSRLDVHYDRGRAIASTCFPAPVPAPRRWSTSTAATGR